MLNILLVYVLSESAKINNEEFWQLLKEMPPEGLSEIFSSPYTFEEFREYIKNALIEYKSGNFCTTPSTIYGCILNYIGRTSTLSELWNKKLTLLHFTPDQSQDLYYLLRDLHNFVGFEQYKLVSASQESLTPDQISIEQVEGGLRYKLINCQGRINSEKISPALKQKLETFKSHSEREIHELHYYLPEILKIISTQDGINLFSKQEQLYWETIMKVALFVTLKEISLSSPPNPISMHILNIAKMIQQTPLVCGNIVVSIGEFFEKVFGHPPLATLRTDQLVVPYVKSQCSSLSNTILEYIIPNFANFNLENQLENLENIDALEAFKVLVSESGHYLQYLQEVLRLASKKNLSNELMLEQILQLFKKVINSSEPKEGFEKNIQPILLCKLLSLFNVCLSKSFSTSKSKGGKVVCYGDVYNYISLLLYHIQSHRKSLDGSCWNIFLDIFLNIRKHLEEHKECDWESVRKLLRTICDFYVVCICDIEKHLSKDTEFKKTMLRELGDIVTNFVSKNVSTLTAYVINELCEYRQLESSTLDNALEASHNIRSLSAFNLSPLSYFTTLYGFLKNLEDIISLPNKVNKYHEELKNLLLFLEYLTDSSKKGCRYLFIEIKTLEDLRFMNVSRMYAPTQAIIAEVSLKKVAAAAAAEPSEQEILENNVHQGLQFQEIVGDDDCLYRAVTYYLTNKEDVGLLREIVAENLEDNTEKYRDFISLGENESLQDYVNKVRNKHEWAGNVEINILMYLLNRPIVIIRSDGAIRNTRDIEQYKGEEPIFVLYNGGDERGSSKPGHYNVLLLRYGYDGRNVLTEILARNSQTFAIVLPKSREAAATQRLEDAADDAKANPKTSIAPEPVPLALAPQVAKKAEAAVKRANLLVVGEPSTLTEKVEVTAAVTVSPSRVKGRSGSISYDIYLAQKCRLLFHAFTLQEKEGVGERAIPLVSVSQEDKVAEKSSGVSEQNFFTTPVKKQTKIKQFFAQSAPVQEAFKKLEESGVAKDKLSSLRGKLNDYYIKLIKESKDDAAIKNDISRIFMECIYTASSSSYIDLIAKEMIKIYKQYLSENRTSTKHEEVDGSYAPSAKSPK